MNALVSLAPRSFDEALRFAQLAAKSALVPAQYRGKPEDVLLAVQWGAEVGLSPLQALQNIAVINGRPSIFGDAALALVRGSSSCEDVIETIEGDGDKAVAVCIAKRRGKQPTKRTFSVDDAKRAGLWSKQGPWQQYPHRMLAQRARGFALRDAFPDVLRGVITQEEAADIVDVTPTAIVSTPPKEEPAVSTPTVADQMEQWRAEREGAPALADLMGKMETAACQGMERLKFVWLNELTAKDRGALGAHGRSSGPNMDRWKTIASHFDASKQIPSHSLPGETERPAVEPPSGEALPPAESTTDAFGLGEHPDDAFFREVLNAVEATTVPAGLDEVKARWDKGGIWHKRMEELPQTLWAELMVRVGDHEKALEAKSSS